MEQLARSGAVVGSRPAAWWAGVTLMVALLLLGVGCAQRYAITLNNGATIISQGKPRREGSYYIYRDESGSEQRVNELRVRAIEVQ